MEDFHFQVGLFGQQQMILTMTNVLYVLYDPVISSSCVKNILPPKDVHVHKADPDLEGLHISGDGATLLCPHMRACFFCL